MNELDLKMHIVEAGKICLDSVAQRGCFISAWQIGTTDYNGVTLSGDGNDMIVAAANIVDKIAAQYNVPYKQVLADIKKILQYVQKQRKPGEQLYNVTKIPFDNDNE